MYRDTTCISLCDEHPMNAYTWFQNAMKVLYKAEQRKWAVSSAIQKTFPWEFPHYQIKLVWRSVFVTAHCTGTRSMDKAKHVDKQHSTVHCKPWGMHRATWAVQKEILTCYIVPWALVTSKFTFWVHQDWTTNSPFILCVNDGPHINNSLPAVTWPF